MQRGRCAKSDDIKRAYAMTESWQGAQIEKENKTGVRMSNDYFTLPDNVSEPEYVIRSLRDIIQIQSN